MQLAHLIFGVPGVRLISGDAATRICDITEDSRTAQPGSLFIARAGLHTDGKAFVSQAEAAGAAAILADAPVTTKRAAVLIADNAPLATARIAERFYGDPSARLALAAVTGTNGKTTVASLIHQICNHAGARCGLIGTVEIDDGHRTAPAGMTTPPAVEISRTLGVMTEAGCACCALEASSHALHQHRLDAVNLAVGVFTNLSGDHLDYHGSMDAYADAKARLFELLPADGIAVINTDDPWAERVTAPAAALPPQRRLTCSILPAGNTHARWHARCTDSNIEGATLHVTGTIPTADKDHPIEFTARAPLLGQHNHMNTLQAAAAAAALLARAGKDPKDIQTALPSAIERLRAPRGRLERVPQPRTPASESQSSRPHVFIDYAHTDDALINCLNALRPVVPNGASLWCVFGCGGDRDTTKRPRMGHAAATLADHAVVTSDNPRTEPPADIISHILQGVPETNRDRVTVHADREQAINFAIQHARPADVIVIAGKGHETEQVLPHQRPDGTVTTRTIAFDDKAVAAQALQDRAERPPG